MRYTSSTKMTGFRADHPLSNEIIGRYAPSILATEPHQSRTDAYRFIPTIEVLDSLRSEGFQPFEVRQTKVRDDSRREFTKHVVRLRHPDAIGTREEAPELLLLNSHDGTSSYRLMAGFFRFVCSNGLVAGDICGDIRVRHSGRIVDDVIEGAVRVLDDVKLAGDRIDAYRSISLDRDEQQLLARSALMLRWNGEPPITTDQALRVRRAEDVRSDLWTTFNRIQENLTQGGLQARSATGRRVRTKPVTGIDQDVKLNRSLWSLADGMAKLKAAA